MPTKQTRSQEEIKRRQLKHGIIPSLTGKNTTARDRLAEELVTTARTKILPPYALTREDISTYLHKGRHYESHMGNFPTFDNFVQDQLTKAKRTGKRVKWLDIGPGFPTHFMPYFERSDPENNLIELHTLSPEQILPKTRHTGNVTGRLVLTGGTVKKRELVSNPEYEKWGDRLKHHVGAIQTYDQRKLGSRYSVIVSTYGGISYTENTHLIETLKKNRAPLSSWRKGIPTHLSTAH